MTGTCRPHRGRVTIVNDIWALGPNVTGYPGGFPNGLLHHLRKSPYWSPNRLHVCAGSIKDGLTVDIRPEAGPNVLADGHALPFRDSAFDLVLLDPPYSEDEARELYATPPPNPVALVKEALRVTRPGGHVALLHRNVVFGAWRSREAESVALIAIYHATPAFKPLRALQVWRKHRTRQVTLHA